MKWTAADQVTGKVNPPATPLSTPAPRRAALGPGNAAAGAEPRLSLLCPDRGPPPGALCASLRHRTGHAPAATPRPRQGRSGMAEPAGGGQRSECGRGDGLRAEGTISGLRAGWETSRPRTLGVWLEELILGLTATPTPHPGSPEVQDAQGAWPGARRGLCGRAPVPTTHCGPPALRLPRVGTCHGACAPEGPGVAPGCVTVTRNKYLEKCTFLRDCFFNRLV